jgi:hypothetical protein
MNFTAGLVLEIASADDRTYIKKESAYCTCYLINNNFFVTEKLPVCRRYKYTPLISIVPSPPSVE